MDVNVVSVNSRTEAERVLCELQLESGGGGIDDDKILQIKKVCQLQRSLSLSDTHTHTHIYI